MKYLRILGTLCLIVAGVPAQAIEPAGVKFLFFDNSELQTCDGLIRRLEVPRKHAGNPLLVSDHPVEGNYMQFYGTVLRRPGAPWQMWYKSYNLARRGPALGYAESDDGLKWRRPELNVTQRD